MQMNIICHRSPLELSTSSSVFLQIYYYSTNVQLGQDLLKIKQAFSIPTNTYRKKLY